MRQVRTTDAGERETVVIDHPQVYRTRDDEQNIVLYHVYTTHDGAITQTHMSVDEARALRDRLNELLSARDIDGAYSTLRYADMPHGKYGRSEIEEAGDSLAAHLNALDEWRWSFNDALGKHELPKRVMAELERLDKFAEHGAQYRRAFRDAEKRLRAWERGKA